MRTAALVSKPLRAGWLALILVGLTVGCGQVKEVVDPGPKLHLPDVSAGIGVNNAPVSVAYTFDDVPLCLEEPGSVTIDSIELANPAGGLSLRRFSVRDSPESGAMSYLRTQRTTLAEVGYPDEGPFVVDQVCYSRREQESDERVSLLGFEVERAADAPDGPAYSTGLEVHYTSEGDERSAFVGFAVLLCPGEIARRPDCDVHEVRRPD